MLVRLSIKMLTAALCKPLRTNHTVVYAKFFCCLLIMSAACFSNRNLSITMENTRGNGVSKKFWSNLLMKILIKDILYETKIGKKYSIIYQNSMPNNIIS